LISLGLHLLEQVLVGPGKLVSRFRFRKAEKIDHKPASAALQKLSPT
jgi:hypothetical protein